MAVTKEKLFAGTENLLTLRDWVRFAVSSYRREHLFFGQGCDNAYDEAVYLILSVLNLPQEGPETFFDTRLTASEIESVKVALGRRIIERVPAAYITREAWLGSCRFYVDERVIVPRSYFAEIISGELMNWVADADSVVRVADVCTGGGSLAILLALAFPQAHVDAFDISVPALQVAQKNVEDYGLSDRVSLFESDVLSASPAKEELYDIIVSNPPYEPENLRKDLPEEFRHEPDNALFSGADGMDVIRKLLRQAAKKLKPNGLLLIEVGGLHDDLQAAFPQIEFNWLPTADESDCVCLLHATDLKNLEK
ncbi:MAG: 50S ribosomal protein L3 N(5)-glutamine methyltransferase [Opitutales bacterium]|nr:50S ribosomal protein L3 N(5)-glutamine methyltransferase [Opitutales bacterium]